MEKNVTSLLLKALEVGIEVMSGPEADIKVGNALPLKTFQWVQLSTTSN